LYLPAEPVEALLPFPIQAGHRQPLSPDEFRQRLQFHAIAVGLDRPGNTLHERYRSARDRLASRDPLSLSADEVVSLSGYQLRLRDVSNAMALLREASRRFPRDARLSANLGMAMHAAGDPNAVEYQSIAADLVPASEAWQRRLERTLLKLFRLRAQETRSDAKITAPDDLFGFRFTAEDGSYRPGPADHLDPVELAEATAAVQQLLFWLPDDTRLYWLLAELYNARGDVQAAAAILDECVDARRAGYDELRDHRRILKDEAQRMSEEQAAEVTRKTTAEQEARRWLPETPQLIAVVVIGGGLFLLLVGLQVRQILRGVKGGCRPCGE
jgi:tetratricopeptide (TPR) repeat protein